MKHLVYKTVKNTISICTPAAKQDVQRDLLKMALNTYMPQENSLHDHAKNLYINGHELAAQYEIGRGASRAHHDRRITWANTVQDFTALTDDEFDRLIECDVPETHQYKFWIDHEIIAKIKQDPRRDDWCDITPEGEVQYKEAAIDDTKIATIMTPITNNDP